MVGSFVKASRIKLAIRTEKRLRDACDKAEKEYADAAIAHKTACNRIPGAGKTSSTADSDMVMHVRLGLLAKAEAIHKEWDRLADQHLVAEQRVRELLGTAQHLRTPLIGMIQGAIASFVVMICAPEFHTALLAVAAKFKAALAS